MLRTVWWAKPYGVYSWKPFLLVGRRGEMNQTMQSDWGHNMDEEAIDCKYNAGFWMKWLRYTS